MSNFTKQKLGLLICLTFIHMSISFAQYLPLYKNIPNNISTTNVESASEQTGILIINNMMYEAVNFEQDQHFELIKTTMICPQCSQQAFYRRITKNGREACFGASHIEGCTLATSDHDNFQDVENEVNATDQRIVVNFGNAIVTDTNQAMDLNTLLQSLMESDAFRSSGAIIAVPGRGEHVASDLFVKFSDITPAHDGCYHCYWGKVKYTWPDQKETLWFNTDDSTVKSAPSALLDTNSDGRITCVDF